MNDEKFIIEAKVNKKDKDLKSIIQACGIEYPHESLGFFSSTYAEFEKANKNRVILASSVKNQVSQLRGTQVNVNHLRRNWIIGTILDAWIEKNEIKIAFSFYKSVYPELWQQALTDFENGELNVSFELRVAKADIESLSGGIKKLKKVSFDGVGLLFSGVAPACDKAIVFDTAMLDSLREQDLVFAKLIQENKETKQPIQQFEGNYWTAKYINSLPDTSFAVIEPSYLEGTNLDKRARHLPFKDHNGHVNASHYRLALRQIDKLTPITDSITQNKLIECAQDVLNKVNVNFEEENKVDKKVNDELLAKLKADVVAEFGEEAIKDWTDEDYTEEKILALRESLKEKSEIPAEEVANEEQKEEATEEKEEESAEEKEEVAEEQKEEISEEAQVVNTKVTETRVYDVTEDSEKGTMEVVETIISQREVDGKIVKDEKVVRNTVYTQASVDAIKADYEAKLAEKDAEIEKVKTSAVTIANLRAELGDYVKDISDEDLLNEDKVEIARLKKERDELKASKEVKTEVVEETASEKTEDVKLETGAEETEDDEKADVKGYLKEQHRKYASKK